VNNLYFDKLIIVRLQLDLMQGRIFEEIKLIFGRNFSCKQKDVDFWMFNN
jgi:hypothetical protein